MSIIVEFESFPIKKCTIKATPSMSIQSITSQACTALKLDRPEAYQLQLKKQILQPSLSFRLSGIPLGSKLQLIYKGVSLKPQKVTIALQTEESGRIIDTFDASCTLWEMLLHFEVKCAINLTRKTGIPGKKSAFQTQAEVYIMPVCVFMNKEYSRLSDLKNTTFTDMGLGSGTGSIRLLEQFTTSSIDEFLEEIENNPPKKDLVAPVESDAKPSINPDIIENLYSPPTDLSKASSPLIEQSVTSAIVDHASTSEDRPDVQTDLKIYKPPSDGSSPANIQLPASFYSLNTSELKVLIDGQRANLATLENRPLMTKALREREQKLIEQKYPKTMVRVRFPDRYILEATFYSGDKVESLFKLISGKLASPGSFRLYITPPQTDLDPSLTFWKSKLAPASLIHFAPGDSSPELNAELIQCAIDYPVPKSNVPSISTDEIEIEKATDQGEVPEDHYQSIKTQTNVQQKHSEKKTPKWFRL